MDNNTINNNIKYKPKSFRLNQKTVERLEELRGEVSWNKFFIILMDKYEKKP